MKLCKDCRHYDGTSYCSRETYIDPVNGKLRTRFANAHCERTYKKASFQTTSDPCGPEAKHFEQAPPKEPEESLLAKAIVAGRGTAKRFFVIKRRFWTMLILKTQKPEYYSICQRKIYELERENEMLRERLKTQGENMAFYCNIYERMSKHLSNIKELRRVRGLPKSITENK